MADNQTELPQEVKFNRVFRHALFGTSATCDDKEKLVLPIATDA